MSDQHDNFERDLADRLKHLAESAVPDGTATTHNKVDVVRWPEQPRRRIFDVVAAAAAVILVVVGFVVVTGQRDDPGAVRTDYPPTPDTSITSPPATTSPAIDPDAEEAARKRAEEEAEEAHEREQERLTEERNAVRAANEQLIADRFAEIGVDYAPLAERRVAYLDPEQYPAPDPIPDPLTDWVANGGSRADYMAVADDGSTITWGEGTKDGFEPARLELVDVESVAEGAELPVGVELYRNPSDHTSSLLLDRGAMSLRSVRIHGPEDLDSFIRWIVEVADKPLDTFAAPQGYTALGRPTINTLFYSDPETMVELVHFDVPIPDGLVPVAAASADQIVGDGYVESREFGWQRRAWRQDDHTIAAITIWNANDEPDLMDELVDATQVGPGSEADITVREEGFPRVSMDQRSIDEAEIQTLILGDAFVDEYVPFALAVSRNLADDSVCVGYLMPYGGGSTCTYDTDDDPGAFCVADLISNESERKPSHVRVLVDSERADQVAFGGAKVTTRSDSGTSGGHSWTLIEATLLGGVSESTGVSVAVTVDGEPCGASLESTSTSPGTVSPSPVETDAPSTERP